ncbi:MAG: hypothetical protein WBP54_05085 [Pelodictyon phaeoclathratiforme]
MLVDASLVALFREIYAIAAYFRHTAYGNVSMESMLTGFYRKSQTLHRCFSCTGWIFGQEQLQLNESVQKNIFNIAATIKHRRYIDIAVGYPVQHPPRRNNQLTITISTTMK